MLSRFAGTTGKPKGAAISHDALIVQSLAKIAVVNYCSTDVRFQNSAISNNSKLMEILHCVYICQDSSTENKMHITEF